MLIEEYESEGCDKEEEETNGQVEKWERWEEIGEMENGVGKERKK